MKALLAVQALALLYHALIVTGVVPYALVWGGRLTSVEQMYQFEAVSVSINLVMVALVLLRSPGLGKGLQTRFVRGLCAAFGVLFVLNTLGNLVAESAFEMIVFTPLTLLSSLCFFRLALTDDVKTP